MNAATRASAMVLCALLAGCPQTQKIAECVDAGDCEGIAVCNEQTGTCEDVECLASSQCAMGSYCKTQDHACTPGCKEPSDCMAGQECDETGTCVEAGCRNTVLDCTYGEYCDTTTGVCWKDPAPHCAPANTTAEINTCVYTYGGVYSCWDTNDCYCILPCANGTNCPRGFECYDEGIYGFLCIGDCPYLVEHGL